MTKTGGGVAIRYRFKAGRLITCLDFWDGCVLMDTFGGGGLFEADETSETTLDESSALSSEVNTLDIVVVWLLYRRLPMLGATSELCEVVGRAMMECRRKAGSSGAGTSPVVGEVVEIDGMGRP